MRGPAAGLLARCPQMTVLATSRESLAVPGEVTWRVPSLTFPWPEHLPALKELENFEAAALFLARARAAHRGLSLGHADVAAVTSICFHLDGIPLALELAAARVGAMGLEAIARRLTGSFELLARSGGGPARHQTLRASVEWSHQLLADDECALFRRLAVFAGGWTLEAAEAACAGPPIPPGHVARLLAALADKSLVHVERPDRGTRYRLLEVIRAFAHERLATSGEETDLRMRHARYFAELGERSAPLLIGPQQADRARHLDQETENLRAARRWCGEDPAALTSASGLPRACGSTGTSVAGLMKGLAGWRKRSAPPQSLLTPAPPRSTAWASSRCCAASMTTAWSCSGRASTSTPSWATSAGSHAP